MKNLKYIILCCSLFALSACSTKIYEKAEVPHDIAVAHWASMEAQTPEPSPFHVEGSLRFGEVNDTRRVTYILWGGNTPPYRLDIFAGIGVLAAQVYDNTSGIVIFLPQENKAYTHFISDRAFAVLGLDLPFGLIEISNIVNGRFPIAVGDSVWTEAVTAPNDAIVYTLHKDKNAHTLFYLSGTWELDKEARPITWKEDQWDVNFSYNDANTRLPYKIDGKNKEGTQFTLLIKERKTPLPQLTDDIYLEIPQNVPIIDLQNYEE